MKNSRKDGMLLVDCKKAYKIAVNGEFVDGYRIVCKDINYQAENIAFDLEQMMLAALVNIKTGNTTNQQADDSNDDFYDNEAPSMADVEKAASGLEIIVKMSTGIELSKLVEKFVELIHCGLIFCENNIKMTIPIWQTVNRNDKLKIVFSYISFFVNPLQSAALRTVKQENLQGQKNEQETQ